MTRAKFLLDQRRWHQEELSGPKQPDSSTRHKLNLSSRLSPTKQQPTTYRSLSMFVSSTLLISTLILLALSQQLVDPIYGLSVGPSLSITPPNPTYSVSVKEDFSLQCKSQGETPSAFSLKWKSKRYSYEELKKRHIIDSESEPATLSLEFRKSTPEDSDTFICYGTYQGNELQEQSVQITFYNPIQFHNCPERQELVVGENRKIFCEFASDSSKVDFRKDGAKINGSSRYKWNNLNALELTGPAEPSDAGIYSVSVYNGLSGTRKTQEIHVAVSSKPKILPHSEGIFHAVAGEQALLECKVEGVPRPLIYWTSPLKKNLTQEGGYVVSPDKGTLLIERVSKEKDLGTFTCHAVNGAGKDQHDFEMHVDTRPRIVQFFNKTVDENQEVEFECRAVGEPKPVFSLRRQGLNQKPYVSGDGFLIDQSTDSEGGGSDVWVYRARVRANRSHFGQIFCNATNRAGTYESVAELSVNYKPDLSGTSPEQYVRLGKQIAVTCHIRAHPKPLITWYVDNTQLLNVTSNMKEGSDKQVYIVTMKPPEPVTAGRFVCKAQNAVGQSEQVIIPRFSKEPGPVQVSLVEAGPTTVKLMLTVPNDGGDRVRTFRYIALGRTLDFNNPTFAYRIDSQNESIIDAQYSSSAIYTIKNLLPYYSYTISFRAVNEVGAGDIVEFHVDTLQPTRPNAPTIVKPNLSSSSHTTRGVPSDYNNGFLLKWSPPELDNGDPITKYIIKFNEVRDSPLGTPEDVGEQRIIEKVDDKITHASLGPLISGLRYKVQLQARNKYGDSKADHIIVYVPFDKPSNPEFEAQTLAWLTESPTTLVAMLSGVTVLLILIDLVSCFCCQIGLCYYVRNKCCPIKSNSVVTDKIMDP